MAKARAKASSKSAKSASRMMDGGSLGGFTIIEVVLVLAIAGLIFMMVFIALPNLQRAQRDTERRNALGEMAAQIQQYQANNNGRLPSPGQKYDAVEEEKAPLLSAMCTGDNAKTTKGSECFIKNYMNSAADENGYNTFVDPDGWTYGLTIQKWDNNMPTVNYEDHMIYMFIGAKCDGEDVEKSTNSRNYALYYKLEGNSSVCTTNAS